MRPLSSGRTEIAEVILDASALVEWLLPGPRHEEVAPLFEDPELELLAPDLILSEVANAFRKAWRAENLSSEDLSVAIDNLSRVAVSTVGVRPLLPAIGPMLLHLSAYDAAYLALAISRAAPIATFDSQLAGMAEARDIPLILR